MHLVNGTFGEEMQTVLGHDNLLSVTTEVES
jgi:hypothetical protein